LIPWKIGTKHRSILKKDKKIIFYLVSPRYSGSTLLGFVLGYFDDVSTIGERRKFYTKALAPDDNEKRCSCGKAFTECDNWNSIKEKFLKKSDGIYPNSNFTQFFLFKKFLYNRIQNKLFVPAIAKRLLPKSLLRKIFAPLIKANQHLIDSILELDHNSIFFDTSKGINHAIYLSLLDEKEYELKVMFLTRLPQAQVSSAMKHNDWSVEKATEVYIKEMNHNLNLFKAWNVDMIHMTYEEFCREPVAKTKELAAFAGIDASTLGDELNFRDKEQHIMGNEKMRLGSSSTISERFDWKDRLSADQIDFITEQCAPIQKQIVNFG